MRYTVEPPALDVSAEDVARVLVTLGQVRIDEDLTPLIHAFAGGVTVARLAATTIQWEMQLAAARARLRLLASALVEAADGYRGIESRTAQQLTTACSDAP